jgi:hypothetical protein
MKNQGNFFKQFFILFSLSVSISQTNFIHAQKSPKYPGVAVIELFTSQGDINSPKADALLSNIISEASKNQSRVFCISMHVDFWNRFGWKDPFSSFRFTNRLKNYTSILGKKETYTPFMLLNGKTELPVNNPTAAKELIKNALNTAVLMEPEFTYQVFDDTLDISYDVKENISSNKEGSDKYLNVAIIESGLITDVTKGDNEGKQLHNDNVCRLFFSADLKLQKGVIRVPLKSVKPGNNKNIILYIQNKSDRKVVGASSAAFPK